jgi:hypothetical protein
MLAPAHMMIKNVHFINLILHNITGMGENTKP